jgi:hypothetical protein
MTRSSALRLLPLALDSWDAGHELPDVVGGRVFSQHIFVRLENRGTEVLHGIRLRVLDSAELEATHGSAITLQSGQRGSVHTTLVQPVDVGVTACPLRVHLQIEAHGVSMLTSQPRLRCRGMHDRITFVYVECVGGSRSPGRWAIPSAGC